MTGVLAEFLKGAMAMLNPRARNESGARRETFAGSGALGRLREALLLESELDQGEMNPKHSGTRLPGQR